MQVDYYDSFRSGESAEHTTGLSPKPVLAKHRVFKSVSKKLKPKRRFLLLLQCATLCAERSRPRKRRRDARRPPPPPAPTGEQTVAARWLLLHLRLLRPASAGRCAPRPRASSSRRWRRLRLPRTVAQEGGAREGGEVLVSCSAACCSFNSWNLCAACCSFYSWNLCTDLCC